MQNTHPSTPLHTASRSCVCLSTLSNSLINTWAQAINDDTSCCNSGERYLKHLRANFQVDNGQNLRNYLFADAIPFFLVEIMQYHAYYSNARLKADVPEFRDFVPFEQGVLESIRWMEENNRHQPSDAQAFIDVMVKEEAEFRRKLEQTRAAG